MKKILLPISLILFFLVANSTNYYVSSSGGSDSNNGLTTATAWQTLSKVNGVTLAANDSVLFKRGDTFVGQIIPQRSTISYSSYGTGEKPIISGFQTLSGWSSAGGGVYTASTTVDNTANVVTVDGVNTAKGRYPNSTFLRFESHTGTTSITDSQLTGTPNRTGQGIVIKSSRYTLEQRTILSHSTTTLTFSSVSHALQDGYGYFFQNAPELLDSIGEWYTSGGTFYMYFGGVNPTTKVVKVGAYADIIFVQNKTDITISNLTIEGGNNSCVYSNVNCTNFILDNCTLRYSGNYGTTSTATGYTVKSCYIHDCNNFAIYSYATSALFQSNVIDKIGLLEGMGGYTGYMGIAANGNTSITENNTITNVGYNGIILRGNGSIVRNNFLDTYNVILDDGGGIYTSNNTYTGRIIDHNICVNGVGNFLGCANYSNSNPSTTPYSHGIYLDEMAADITVSNNTTANNSDSGIFLHSSTNIDVSGNISYNNNSTQLLFSHNTVADNMANINVINNIFVAKEATQRCFYFTSNYNDLNFGSASGNIYARPTDDNLTIYVDPYNAGLTAYTLDGWKTLSGYDATSTKSPYSVPSVDSLYFQYNATSDPVVENISGTYKDMSGTVSYTNTVSIPAYSSVVLLKSTDIGVGGVLRPWIYNKKPWMYNGKFLNGN